MRSPKIPKCKRNKQTASKQSRLALFVKGVPGYKLGTPFVNASVNHKLLIMD